MELNSAHQILNSGVENALFNTHAQSVSIQAPTDKKMEGEGTTTEILHTFLEVYRSTPNPNSPRGTTPAESFIGRK